MQEQRIYLSDLAAWIKANVPMLRLVVIAAILLCLIAPPLFFLILTSFSIDDMILGWQGFTLEHYRTVLSSGATLDLLAKTLAFAVGSSLVGLFVGGMLAWIVERTNTPLRKLAYVAVFLHFATPAILRVIGWILLIGPKAGYINIMLRKISHLELGSGPLNIFSMTGMIFIQGMDWSSLVFLLMAAPLRSMDPSLEEAAAISGAGVWKTIQRVTLPLALPSILSVLLLAFVRCLEAFEVPALIGIPAGVHVFTTKIWLQTKSIRPDFGIACAYSMFTLLLVAGGLYLYSRATKASYRFQTITGKAYRPKVTDLGKWRYVTMLLILFVPLFDVLPLLILTWASFLPYYTAPSWELLSKLTLANYSSALTFSHIPIMDSVKNSLLVSSAGATIAVLLATIVAWTAVRTKIRGRWFVDALASFPLVFPGVVLGVGLIKAYLVIPLPIYATLWIVIIGYVVRYLPYAMRYCHPGLLQISHELEESATVSGASWFAVFRKILLPLMMPAIFGGWIWIFLVSFRELSLSIMLVGPNTSMVAVAIYELWQSGQVNVLCAFGVMLSAFLIILSLGFQKFSKRYGIQGGA